MNPRKLNQRIKVLSLNKTNNSYTWSADVEIWGKVTKTDKSNIFSNVGIGTKSIQFTIRKKSNFSLHNAFMWKGKHCFITSIEPIDLMYYEITTALIEPHKCSVEREGKPKLDELNRPVFEEVVTITFPGCLTEKYIRQTNEQPMSTIETRYVLVTPKLITLHEGEIITIDGVQYESLVIHDLDEYKNEYEISARRNP